jgi:spore maturation protein CgeB
MFFEDGKDLLAFGTLEEAIDKVMWALAHPAEAEAIAGQGHQSVQPHTWDARIAHILEAV